MEFKIKFRMDNAIFDEAPEAESARILRKIAGQVEEGRTSGAIVDVNGNTIGMWVIKH